MAKIQPRAGFWPQLDKTWSGPRVLGQHSVEGRVLGQHSLEGCFGHSLERRTGHSLEGRCAVALGLCRGPDAWTVARSRRDREWEEKLDKMVERFDQINILLSSEHERIL